MSNKDEKQPLIKLNPIPDDTMNALLSPAASSIGNAAGDVLDGLFNWALLPLRKYNVVKEKDLEDFAQKTNDKLVNIPKEYRDENKIGIALKTLEDSRYQLNQEQMREYFSNLISNTLDKRINNNLSPKFSEILANMTVIEANTLLIFKNSPGYSGLVPSVSIDIENTKTYATQTIVNDILLANNKYIKNPLELSLLEASNLIEFNELSRLTSDVFEEQYALYENTTFKQLVASNDFKINTNEEKYTLNKHHYSLTEMGRSFCDFVM